LRTGIEGINDLSRVDPFQLKTIPALSESSETLRSIVERKASDNRWLIFTFHGVGCGDPAVDAVEHAAFGLWLAENRTWIEVATIRELCERLARSAPRTATTGGLERRRTVLNP
jgi:hypothetical protein